MCAIICVILFEKFNDNALLSTCLNAVIFDALLWFLAVLELF